MTPIELCEAHPEREVVGVVLDDGTVLELPNVAAEPRHRFEIAPRDWLRLPEERIRVLFHSHPDGSTALSADDLAAFTPGGLPLLRDLTLEVLALRAGRVAATTRYRFVQGHGWQISLTEL